MATTNIHNGALAGAMAALLSGRPVSDGVVASYAAQAAAAAAFATQVVTAANAIGLADTNAAGSLVLAKIALGILEGRPISSVIPGDYVATAAAVAAAAKAMYPDLIAPAAPAVPLLTAGNFSVLSKSGITNVPVSAIDGDMGVSPINAASITGFALALDGGGAFSTSAQVTGQVFAADYVAPTPAMLTQAVSDMEAAYTNAAGRAPDFVEFNAGLLNGQTLTPGVYKWSTGVTISGDITLQGDASSVFIFEMAGTLSLAVGMNIILAGGVLPQNVFWQTATNVAIGAAADFQGIILAFTDISLGAAASMTGKCLSQTAVNFNNNVLTATP